MEGRFKEGKRDGYFKHYGSEGLDAEGAYKEGKQDGLFKYYFNGFLDREVNFKDGKEEGLARVYYSNGTIQEEWFFINGEFENHKCWTVKGKKIRCKKLDSYDKLINDIEEYIDQ